MYPTTIDMVYAEDGKTPIFDKESGDWTANNALKLGGRPAEDYALKGESSSSSGTGVPDGGAAGQTLVKQSDEDGDAVWATPNLMDSVYEDPQDEEITEEMVYLRVVADDAHSLGGKPSSYYEDAIKGITAEKIGAVKSVAGKQPDENGNVDLSPSDIDAVYVERNGTDINDPERLTVPLKDKDGYFYPITSYNQIVMPDGTFWDGQASGGEGTVKSVNNKEADENGNVDLSPSDIGALSLRQDGEVIDGTKVVPINATTLNGMTLNELKAAIMAEAVYQ